MYTLKRIIKKIIRIISSLFQPKIKEASLIDRKDVEIIPIYEEDTFTFPLLRDVFGNTHTLFHPYSCKIPAFDVSIITNGRCVIGREEVLSSKNECFVEITAQKINTMIGKLDQMNAIKIKGVVVNLSLSGLENNYNHFCIEWLARLHLPRKSMIKIDYYIVPQKHSFQKQYLDLLGVDSQNILTLDEGSYIEAEHLVVPSLINNWEPVAYRKYPHCLKQWLPSWLNDTYKYFDNIGSDNNCENEKIYISRTLTSYRKLENEEEIQNILKKYGFSTYCLETLTVEEQIKIFRNAKFIVSIHGSGLANMIHCKSTVKIFEIYSEYYHDSSFRILALSLGHKYEYFIGRTPNINNYSPQEEDVYVDPLKFEQAIQHW